MIVRFGIVGDCWQKLAKSRYNARMANNVPMPIDDATAEKPLRDEKGRLLRKLESGAPTITPETARSMVARRWDNYRRAAANRITREAAAIDPTVNTPADAWGVVVAKQYTALLDADKPRGDDLYRMGQIIGALPTVYDKADANSASQIDDAAAMILARIAELAARDVVDGTVIRTDNGEK